MQRLGFVVAMLVCGVARADAPRTQKQQEADKLFAEGRELLVNQKNPKAACEKFELAASADPTAAGTMLNLGLCYEELDKPHTALKWFRRAQAQASEQGLPDHEDAAKKHTADLVNKVPVISIGFSGAMPTEPHVRIDNDEIPAGDLSHVEIDPGEHAIEVRAPHRKVSRGHITVAPRNPKVAEAVQVTIALEEGEPTMVVDRGRKRRLTAIGLGIGAVAIWTGDFIFGVYESNRFHCAKDALDTMMTCGDTKATGAALTKYANDRVDALKYTGTAIFIVGAAALAAGAYMFFTAPGKVTVDQYGSEHVSLAPIIAPDQVGFAISGGF
jgi:hypothetical protein